MPPICLSMVPSSLSARSNRNLFQTGGNLYPMLLKLAKGKVPRISETERQALEAGTVWVDGELFAGRPDFGRMLREPWPALTERERAFLDGPVETVCAMADPGKEPSPEV